MNLQTSNAVNLLPLAQRDAWESLGNRFSGDHAKFNVQDLWGLLAVLLAGVALVWLLRWLYRRQQGRRLSCEPRHLFADLCAAHRLRRCDRKLLERLGEYHDPGVPAIVFVRPDLFDADCLPDADEKTVQALQRLKAKLFAGLESDGAAAPPSPAPPQSASPVVAAPIASTEVPTPGAHA